MKESREAESISGPLKEPCNAGGPMMYHRDLWEALGGKDKLALSLFPSASHRLLKLSFPSAFSALSVVNK